jgi:hypothetical protein
MVTPEGTFVVEFEVWDEQMSDLLQGAVPRAAEALQRWGHLQQPVRITVVWNHAALEAAAGRRLPGMSAWARRTQVFLENPRRWPLPPGLEQDPQLEMHIRRIQVTSLLRHELTHSLMFQLAGVPPTDPEYRIPFWFREGMATVTANEFSQWPPPLTLAQWLDFHPEVNLLRDSATLVRTDGATAYGGALHGFDFLVHRYGDAAVLRVLARMHTGERFAEAFQAALGVTPEAFASDFDRYLRWRGFVLAPSSPPPRSETNNIAAVESPLATAPGRASRGGGASSRCP